MSRLPGASRDGIGPNRVMARQASRSELSQQSNPNHPGRIRAEASAGIGRGGRHRRNAAGLVAGIIALGLVGLCLRAVPTVLTNSDLVTQVTGPLAGIPVASSSRNATVTPSPTANAKPSTPASNRVSPVKLQAKRKAKSLRQVEVPGSGPGTYQSARKGVMPTSSSGSLIRYDVRVEDGLSINPDQAAEQIQK
ncbi:MAG TPA: hypothetical protein VFP01_02580, partial [Propionibacteriaceae bacterium]|nr:hypothetical protein [Propionibacteriaceae bacterium]